MRSSYHQSLSLFWNIATSDLSDTTHDGLGHFVDEPIELYHARAWTASNHTTSGEFAHISMRMGPRLSLLCVQLCALRLHQHRLCQSGGKPQNAYVSHYGLVFTIDRNHRSNRRTSEPGEVAVQIQEAFARSMSASMGCFRLTFSQTSRTTWKSLRKTTNSSSWARLYTSPYIIKAVSESAGWNYF